MPVSRVAYKQAEIIFPDDSRQIAWFPAPGLRVGTRVATRDGEARAVAVYHRAILYRCPRCQRLCAGDVVDWLRHPDHEGEFDLLYRGFDYHFETPREAGQWALGFHLAWTMAVEDAFHSTRAIRLDGDPRNPRRSE